MAIEVERLSATRRATVGTCSRSLEQIARATVRGGHHHAAGVVTREARELLGCDAALLLTPADSRDSVALAGLATAREDGARTESLWRLGAQTPKLFERPCHTVDGWREPWSGLGERLRGLGLGSWTGFPLRRGDNAEAVGMLAVGSRRGPRPCRRMDRLHALARSSTAALARTEVGSPAEHSGHALDLPHLQTVGNLAFGVSHTLANIFGAILGNLHFLREELAAQDCEELVDRVQRSTHDGIELMRSLQAFTSVPACREMSSVDLADLAAEVMGFVRALSAHWPSCSAVALEVDAQGPCEAWGDAGQLREVLIGLVFNAIHAVGSAGRIVVRARTSGGWSELRVCDDGRGMSDEVLRRAAEPFFTTDPESHQGLGLTVARGVAVGHRGSLKLARRRPHGLEVTLRLPATPPASEQSERIIIEALSTVASDRKGARQ